MKANVYVTLKKEILDPQGKAVAQALRSLGFSEVEGVRVGKVIQIDLGSGKDAQERLRSMCERLLANPVMEDFRYEVAEG